MSEDEADRDAASAPPEAGDVGSIEERRRRFLVASEKVRRALEARGVSERDIQRDFEAWREARRRSRSTSGGHGTCAPSRS
ncbi:MAG: hypothetical protein IPN03_24370 [Holophagales bacterium]|nr:hypothetical protein [Holophagales bacterium]